MDLSKLKTKLAKSNEHLLFSLKIIANNASTEIKPESIEPTKNHGIKKVIEKYEYIQSTCIDKIGETVNDILRDTKSSKHLCVFITGSICRLEYIPGSSDFDFLVFKDKNKKLKIINYSKFFNKFENKLRENLQTNILSEWEKQFGLKKDDIEIGIDGIPLGKNKYFYSFDEVFNKMGKEYESAWAAFERSHLLFENSFVGGNKSLQDKLINKAFDCYCIIDDLCNSQYPLLASSFLNFMLWSSMTAKIAHLKKVEEVSKQDDILLKMIIGRLWPIRIKIITIVFLTIDKISNGIKWGINERSDFSEKVKDYLKSPPIYIVTKCFPEISGDIDENLKLFFVDDYEKINNEYIKPIKLYFSDPTGDYDTLMEHYTKILFDCIDMREKDIQIEKDFIKNMTDIDKKFIEITKKLFELFYIFLDTYYYHKGNLARNSSYEYLRQIIYSTIFPINTDKLN